MLLLEAIGQLPFFFWASYCLFHRLNIIRLPMVIYGAHVATTVAPILAEFAMHETLTLPEKKTLIAFYLPYLLIPIMICWEFALDEEPLSTK